MQASRAARPGVIVAAGVVALVIYSYPGQMTEASFEYLRQARGRFYAPENPPALSAMWRWLELVIAGPSAMLLVQVGAFTAGAYSLLRRALSPTRAAVGTAVMLVFPPLLVPLSSIWSHSMMTGLLTLGAAMLLSERPRVHRGALGVLFAAVLAQPSALFAVGPLVIAWFRARLTDTGLRRYGIAVIAWLAIALAGMAAAKHYTKQPTPVWSSYVVPREEPRFDVPERELPASALSLGIPTRSTAIQDHWSSVNQWLDANTPLFAPWLYLALLVVLAPFASRQRDVWPLLASAAAFHATLIITAWLVAAVAISSCLVIARRRT